MFTCRGEKETRYATCWRNIDSNEHTLLTVSLVIFCGQLVRVSSSLRETIREGITSRLTRPRRFEFDNVLSRLGSNCEDICCRYVRQPRNRASPSTTLFDKPLVTIFRCEHQPLTPSSASQHEGDGGAKTLVRGAAVDTETPGLFPLNRGTPSSAPTTKREGHNEENRFLHCLLTATVVILGNISSRLQRYHFRDIVLWEYLQERALFRCGVPVDSFH